VLITVQIGLDWPSPKIWSSRAPPSYAGQGGGFRVYGATKAQSGEPAWAVAKGSQSGGALNLSFVALHGSACLGGFRTERSGVQTLRALGAFPTW
ncbi:MAG: hypothetical protein DMG16_27250, partial [Acidobacteria bacterium]